MVIARLRWDIIVDTIDPIGVLYDRPHRRQPENLRDYFMTTLLDSDRVASIVRRLLSERFGDTFDFGPILVEKEFDHDGDEYVHVYIVFDGDQDELDPSWTSSLSGRLWPYLVEMGFDSPPASHS